MNTIYLGYLLTMLSAAGFASLSLFLKLVLDTGVGVYAYTLVSSVLSLLILAAMSARHDGPVFPDLRRRWPGYLLFGACGAVSTIAFNVALVYLSISLATILIFTYPAFVALGAWLWLGQKPSGGHVAALALTLLGAVCTVDIREAFAGNSHWLGIGLAFLTAIAHGVYIVMGERLAPSLPAVGATTCTRFVISAGVLAVYPSVLREVPAIPPDGWAIIVLSTLLAGVTPFLFLNRGIGLIGANRAAVVSVAELPFAMAFGLIFMRDLVSPLQWLGAALITAAVVMSHRQSATRAAHQTGSGTGAA